MATLPECRVLSVLYCGDYAGEDEAWLTLSREVKARELPPPGPRASLALWHPTPGGRLIPNDIVPG